MKKQIRLLKYLLQTANRRSVEGPIIYILPMIFDIHVETPFISWFLENVFALLKPFCPITHFMYC